MKEAERGYSEMSNLKVDERFITSLASRLVKINSENPPGREGEIASFVAERLSDLGLRSWIDRFRDRANAVGVYEGGNGFSLMLITHLDTVPAGDKENWNFPPFGGVFKDGKLYGRGAADAKGPLASMLGALKLLADSGWKVNGKIIFAAVADEEVNSEGVKRLIAKGVKADSAIVGEPTSLNVCVAHKGRLLFSVEFLGKAAHASSPRLGINAIYPASEFALEVAKISGEAFEKHPLLGSSTAAPTIVRGGIKDNMIPEHVEIWIDRRVLPNEKLESIISYYRSIAEKIAARHGAKADLRIKKWVPSSEVDPSSKIVTAAIDAASKILGIQAKPVGFQATCDMSFLVNEAEIPSIVFGPGSLDQAHTVDEWVEVDQLFAAAKIYAAVALSLLGSKN